MDKTEDGFENHSRRIAALERALANLIAWTAQSAGSPISRQEAVKLLDMFSKQGETG